jgi:hypothetical protein
MRFRTVLSVARFRVPIVIEKSRWPTNLSCALRDHCLRQLKQFSVAYRLDAADAGIGSDFGLKTTPVDTSGKLAA